jgi:hypothetical protein
MLLTYSHTLSQLCDAEYNLVIRKSLSGFKHMNPFQGDYHKDNLRFYPASILYNLLDYKVNRHKADHQVRIQSTI